MVRGSPRGPSGRLRFVGILCGGMLTVCTTVAEAATRPRAEEQRNPPRTGFQMTIESGLALPFGDATSAPNDALDRRYSYQIPFNFELGGKVSETLFIGSYLGFALGAEGDDPTIEEYCEDDDDDGQNDVSCSSVSLYIGILGRYGFSPDADWNPWLSYGLGYEATHQSISDQEDGYAESTLSSGVTYLRLSAGVDYRKRSPGIGPALHLAIGRFHNSSTEVDGELAYRDVIRDPAWHLWATLGLRMVIRP